MKQGYVQRENQQFEEVFACCEKRQQGVVGAVYVFGYQCEALALLGKFNVIRERYDRYRPLITEALPVVAVSKVLSIVALDRGHRGDFSGHKRFLNVVQLWHVVVDGVDCRRFVVVSEREFGLCKENWHQQSDCFSD